MINIPKFNPALKYENRPKHKLEKHPKWTTNVPFDDITSISAMGVQIRIGGDYYWLPKKLIVFRGNVVTMPTWLWEAKTSQK